MPRYDASYGGPNFSIRDAVLSLRHLPMTEEPRVRFQYCNLMYMTLSHVIETLTGKWLGDFLRQRIWEPLAMSNTYFSFAQACASDASLAQGYLWNNRTQKYIPLEAVDQSFISGAGAVISNVLDYATRLRFLMSQSPPLSFAGHAALRTPRVLLDSPAGPPFTGTSAYGFGWMLVNYYGEPLIFHNGGLPVFGALVEYLSNRGWGVALMGNTDQTSNFAQNILAFHLMDGKLGVPAGMRIDWQKVMEIGIEERAERIRHPRKYLYPDAPSDDDVIPLSRPLKAYTGVYDHPAYRSINISLSNCATTSSRSHLQIRTNRVLLPLLIKLKHVSGEFIILKMVADMPEENLDLYDPLQVEIFKGESRLGENGLVNEFGIALEEEMGEEKIWFQRLG